ncbi:MAG: LysM domain-containing protein [Clostridiales bacterium]|nr:LysM domain-containing protein [Clostridiales bacterium]
MEVIKTILPAENYVTYLTAQARIDSLIPLPDTRAVRKVLACTAQVTNLEAAAAQGAVDLSGVLALQLILLEAEPFAFTAQAEFTHRIKSEKVAAGMQALAQAQVFECRAEAEDGVLRLHALIALDAHITQTNQVSAVTEISDVHGIETVRGLFTQKRRTLVGSQTLRVQEELSIPSGTKLLQVNGSALVREAVPAHGGILVEGVLHVAALLQDGEGNLRSQPMNLPFSETIAGDATDACEAQAILQDLRAEVTSEADGALEVTASIPISVYAAVHTEIPLLLDAYDAELSFACVQEETESLQYNNSHTKKAVVRETLPIPSVLPESFLPAFVRAVPAITGIAPSDEGAEVDGVLLTTLCYRAEDGGLYSFSEDIPFCVKIDQAEGRALTAQAVVCAATVTGGGRSLDVQITMQLSCDCYHSSIQRYTSMLEGNENAQSRNGIFIYLSDQNETLFSVGKRFGIPVASVMALNPNLKEPMSEGQQIVLVK